MQIFELSLQLVTDTMPLVRRIARVDRDLARQLRRSVMSVPQRMAEGMHSRRGNKSAHFQGAAASAKETEASLRVAVAAGYVGPGDIAGLRDRCDHVSAVMFKLVRRPR